MYPLLFQLLSALKCGIVFMANILSLIGKNCKKQLIYYLF